ncbi:hypothetical protein LCGC14_1803150, partial [marine sediment metagenome]
MWNLLFYSPLILCSIFILLNAQEINILDLFTIVILPDTQFYSSFYAEGFQEQTFWACECAHDKKMNVIFVSQLGDLVHRGNKFEQDWKNAGKAMRNLLRCNLAHGFLPGNHDTDNRMKNPYHYFMKTFPLENYQHKEWFGESFNHADMRNTFQLFDSPQGFFRFVFIHIEYLPDTNESQSILDWASKVLDRYSDRTALLSTHEAGSDCWPWIFTNIKKLMKRHCNLIM